MTYHVTTSLLLFGIGAWGLLFSRRNVLLVIMSLEVMLLSISFNLLFFATYIDDILGYVFVLFVLCVSAAESALGLSLVIAYYKQHV